MDKKLEVILARLTPLGGEVLQVLDTLATSRTVIGEFWKTAVEEKVPREVRCWCLTTLIVGTLHGWHFREQSQRDRWEKFLPQGMWPHVLAINEMMDRPRGEYKLWYELPDDMLDFAWPILVWKMEQDVHSFMHKGGLSEDILLKVMDSCLMQASRDPHYDELVQCFLGGSEEAFKLFWAYLQEEGKFVWVRRNLAMRFLELGDQALPEEFSSYSGNCKVSGKNPGTVRFASQCLRETDKAVMCWGVFLQWLYITDQFEHLAGLIHWSRDVFDRLWAVDQKAFRETLHYVLNHQYVNKSGEATMQEPREPEELDRGFLRRMRSILLYDVDEASDALLGRIDELLAIQHQKPDTTAWYAYERERKEALQATQSARATIEVVRARQSLIPGAIPEEEAAPT